MKNKIYPWVIVFCCCGLATASLSIGSNCAGIFFGPLADSMHVGIGSTSMQLTILNITVGLFSPIAVKICQKFRLRLVFGISAAVMSGCYVLMSCIKTVEQLYVISVLLGIFNAMLGMPVIVLVIGNWFHNNMGLATGISFCFSGLMSAVLSPFLNHIIEMSGWRNAYLCEAVFVAVAIIPALVFIRIKPSEIGMLPCGFSDAEVQTQKAAASKRDKKHEEAVIFSAPEFWILCIISAFMAFVMGFSSHLSGFMTSVGRTSAFGALLLSMAMLGNLS